MTQEDIDEIKKALKDKEIFIAYIEEDRKVAEAIWDKLKELGAKPWAYTKNIDNLKWKKAIVTKIKHSDVMVLVFSKKTDKEAEDHIVKEVGLASKYNIPIIPFMIDDIKEIENPDLAYELEGINWIRKTHPIASQIKLLTIRLSKYFGMNIPTPPEPPKIPWIKIFSLVALLISLGGVAYFYLNYFSQKDKIFYVCYDYNQTKENNTLYSGCKLYLTTCKSNNKKLFNEYSTKEEAQKGLLKCNKKQKITSSILNEDNISDNIGSTLFTTSFLYSYNIDENITPISLNRDDKEKGIYICYDEKKDNKYIGCKQYNTPCSSINKIRFGHYSKVEAKQALIRCLNSTPKITYKEIKSFIDKYYLANESNDIEQLLNFYTDSLDFYINKPNVSKEEIRRGLKLYIRNKPIRSYNVIDIRCLKPLPTSTSAKIKVKVKWSFLDKNDKEKQGETIQEIKIIKKDKHLYIKSIKTISPKKTKILPQSYIQSEDEQLRASDATKIVGKPALLVEFGGIKTPLCQLAISYDGNKFYFKELNSHCVKMKNSKNVNIVCNIRERSNKRICKTYKELREYILFHTLSKIFDYTKDDLPGKINFNPKNPESFIFFAKNKDSLHILKNLPYAIKGYDFSTPLIANYYKNMLWYHSDPNKRNIELNAIEQEWLDSISELQIKLLRNLPYAFKGTIFKDMRLNIFYAQYKWYKPNKNYIPKLNSLNEEDRKWIKDMRRKKSSEIDFFTLFNSYVNVK